MFNVGVFLPVDSKCWFWENLQMVDWCVKLCEHVDSIELTEGGRQRSRQGPQASGASKLRFANAIWLSDFWFAWYRMSVPIVLFYSGMSSANYMDGCLQWPFWCWDWTRLQCLRFQQHLSLWEEDIQGVQLSDRQIFFRCVKNLYSLWNTALPEKMKEK
jgi:hypothetical protein